MYKLPGIFLIALFYVSNVSSQNFVYDMQVQSVTFSGDEMFAILQDDLSGYFSSTQQWMIDEEPVPLAFNSGSYLQASAVLYFNCTSLPSQLYVKAIGTDGIDLPVQLIEITSEEIHYPLSTAEISFADDIIKYYHPFILQWQFSFDNEHWYDAGTSENIIYVTKNTPLAESSTTGFRWQQSLFDISCRNADGASTDTAMIHMIWEDFTDKEVLRADGTPLHYYGDADAGAVCYTLDQFIKNSNGFCGTWANFFVALLKMHGYSEVYNQIGITASSTGDCGEVSLFFVKNWSFGTASNLCIDLPFLNVYNTTLTGFIYQEAFDEAGMPGQSSENPASIFHNHIMAYVDGKIYDASYGNMYTSVDEIKDAVVGAWGLSETGNELDLGLDVNGDSFLDPDFTFTFLRITDDLSAGDFYSWFDTF